MDNRISEEIDQVKKGDQTAITDCSPHFHKWEVL